MIKTNISYVTPDNFIKFIDRTVKEVGRPERYHFEEKVTGDYPMFTKDANTCSILAVNDTLMHLAPERDDPKLFDKLTDFLMEQKDKYGSLSAILLGGKAPNLCGMSTRLYSGIANVLEKEGADYSMICGKKLDLFLDDLYKNGNSYKFTQKGNVGLEELSRTEGLTPKQFKDILKYYYRDVKISRKHD